MAKAIPSKRETIRLESLRSILAEVLFAVLDIDTLGLGIRVNLHSLEIVDGGA